MQNGEVSATERAVIGCLLARGSASRPDLAMAVGMSKPAMRELVGRLCDSGLLREIGEMPSGRRGADPVHFRVATERAYCAGVELQAGVARAVVSDLSGAPLATAEKAEPGSYGDRFTAVVRLAARRAGIRTRDLAKVVVGVPGVVTPDHDLDFVAERPELAPGFRDQLSAALGCTVELENDMNLAAIAEARLGAGRGAASFTLLVLDEAVAAASVIGDRLIRGAHGYAGELGLIPAFEVAPGVTVPGIHALAGSAGLERLAASVGLSVAGLLADESGPGTAAGQARQHLVNRVAQLAAVVCAVTDAERIVLAGATARAGGARLAVAVRRVLRERTGMRATVSLAEVGPQSVATGALFLAVDAARAKVFGGSLTPTQGEEGDSAGSAVA
ncbi:MAG: ROK family protein [Micropruina sp.]|uniref:ROK family protein n=1 Tax=Micropruina sp. TaxID=2737536 RepID=UPI0039E51E5A